MEQGIEPANNNLRPQAITTKLIDTEITYINENQKSQTTKTITENTVLQSEEYNYDTNNLPPLTDSEESETSSEEDRPPNTIRKNNTSQKQGQATESLTGNL